MQKVLHFLYPGVGGLGSVVLNLIEQNNVNKKWENYLIFTGPELSEKNKSFLKKTKAKYYFNKTKKFFTIFSWPKIFIAILKFKPDILLVHNFDIIPSLIYKIVFRKKIIYVDHNCHFGKINLKFFLVYFIVKNFFDKIIVLNKEKLNFFLKINIPKKKISLIPNGIKIVYFKNKKFNKKKLFLGMASRINDKKCHDLVIDIFKSKEIKNRRIFCYFAGDGENFYNLKKKVNELKLNKKIFFLGNLNEKKLNNFYKKIDLYLQASKGEVLSYSILEAFNFGIPVLGSKVEGIKNFLKPKKKIGMLFNNNLSNLKKKIIYFYNLENQKKSVFSKNQKRYLINNFSSEKMYKNYANLLENV